MLSSRSVLALSRSFPKVKLQTASSARTLASSGKPYRILGLQQIAIGGLDKGALKSLWVDSFGLKQKGTFKSEKENVDEDILELGVGPLAIEVDIMQPLDASKSPKVHVPPLNHLGLWVDDIEKAVEHMTKEGFRFTPGGIRVGAAGHKVTFVHPKGNDATPKSGEGVLIELVQAPPEVIAEYDRIAAL
ncbi:methylmalonyl-CoA epimerase [Gonapodya prolifera JEL478]|uniref:Methylmalonyl-CoA epimerase n=1 Tax=Gonapodya prolifera (strain JEL478) TaxID=1344416 RepID=A0A139A5H9_GONPJ|nr:methylmalonyl-CoA epimerase [Gonapodya prolifera JEL478]|eukprot:KXS11889.1 methylmalonyl-CoA epimerase [Gonapodya prolifera JEL478]